MASIGHVVVGLAAARIARPHDAMARRLYTAIGLATLSLLPDLDVVAFRFGIPYEAPFGHRGASHSLFAAAVLGPLVAWAWSTRPLPLRATIALCTVVLASHGLLDMLTDGGEGVAVFWPLSSDRHFFGWQPLAVAPIGRAILSDRGLGVMATELLWFMPLAIYGLWPPRRSPPAITDR
jgi:inner membrane protein